MVQFLLLEIHIDYLRVLEEEPEKRQYPSLPLNVNGIQIIWYTPRPIFILYILIN